jgi:hypothetical protein
MASKTNTLSSPARGSRGSRVSARPGSGAIKTRKAQRATRAIESAERRADLSLWRRDEWCETHAPALRGILATAKNRAQRRKFVRDYSLSLAHRGMGAFPNGFPPEFLRAAMKL